MGLRIAIHSPRWFGSKNKQGCLSLTPFTVRVMSLGPEMGGVFELHNRCEAHCRWLPMSPDWSLHSVTACGVVGTCTISQGSANGLALAAKVQCWPYAKIHNSNPLHLTLIPDELEMRFPCRSQLMLALLWTLSPGIIKGTCWAIGSN